MLNFNCHNNIIITGIVIMIVFFLDGKFLIIGHFIYELVTMDLSTTLKLLALYETRSYS